jgi:hypothetical protein
LRSSSDDRKVGCKSDAFLNRFRVHDLITLIGKRLWN